MFSKLFEALYLKVFVSIVTSGSKNIVYIELCNKKSVLSVVEESFNTTLEHKKMLEFVHSYTKESPFHYISYLDSSPSQGAVPKSIDKSKYFDVSLSNYKSYNNKWLYYTSKSELNLLKKKYADVGVDYIYSPFVVLAQFFKDKLHTEMSMFVLVEEKHITLSIFDNDELLFGQYMIVDEEQESYSSDTSTDDMSDSDDFELDDMSIDLEDVSVMDEVDELDNMIEELDDLDELDDLSDIEDLDDLDEIDEFSQESEAEYNTPADVETKKPVHNELNNDYKKFSMIQEAVSVFYQDEKYNSKFIENIYIADAIESTHDLKHYLEEEMFLSVYVRRIDLCAEICELAKMEHE